MQRVFNEYTADEKKQGLGGVGGVKVGDFGTGGRIYETTYKRSSGAGGKFPSKPIGGCCSLIAVVLLFFIERSLFLTVGCMEEAAESAIFLDTPVVESANEGKLVYVKSANLSVSGSPPRDEFFNIEASSLEKDGALKRVTEYCQWVEFRHSQQTKVGKEPDTCARTSSTDDRCNGVACRSTSSCSSPCCQIVPGDDIYKEEVWYTYHKGWHSQRTSSLLFDNPVAYHNPQRDPAPTAIEYASDINLVGSPTATVTASETEAGLHVKAKDFEAVMLPLQTMYLGKNAVLAIGGEALQSGFGEADHMYVYSRVSEDGLNNPLVRASASYLIDGVIDVQQISKGLGVESLLSKAGLDWITKGTCNAGDIRVHFETRQLPDAVSLIGQQSNGRLVAKKYSNGVSQLILYPALLSMDGLLTAVLSDARWWTHVYRAGVIVMFMAGGYFMISSLWLGSLLASLGFVTMFAYFYGLNDVVVPAMTALISLVCLLYSKAVGATTIKTTAGGSEKTD